MPVLAAAISASLGSIAIGIQMTGLLKCIGEASLVTVTKAFQYHSVRWVGVSSVYPVFFFSSFINIQTQISQKQSTVPTQTSQTKPQTTVPQNQGTTQTP